MSKKYFVLFLFSIIPLVHGRELIENGASDFFTLQKFQQGNVIEVEVYDLKGKKLSVEKIQAENDTFKTYMWNQFQTGDSVELELNKNQLHFKSEKKKKSLSFSDDELKKLVLPPLLTNALLSRIKENPKSKKFDLIVIIPDKMMTLDFIFEKKSENPNEMIWVLNPDSFFVGLIVGPVTITFDKSLKLLRIKDIILPIRPTQKTEINFK